MSNTLDLSDFYKVADIKWHISSDNDSQEIELLLNNGKLDPFQFYTIFINGMWIPFMSFGKSYLRTSLTWLGSISIVANKDDYIYIPCSYRPPKLIKELAWNTLANLSEEDVAYVPVLTNIVNS